jgi:hypothetical protein
MPDAPSARRRTSVGSLEAALKNIAGVDAATSAVAKMASRISADQAASFQAAAAQLASIEIPRLTAPGIVGASEALRSIAVPRLDATAMLGAATPHLVDRWRESAVAGLGEQFAAADSMARVIGEANLGYLAAETFAPANLIGEPLRQAISEAAETYSTRFGRVLRDQIHASVLPAALMATNTLRATVEAQIEEGRRAHDDLREMGWWFPPNAPVTLLYRFGRIASTRKRVDLRRAMVSVGQSRWFGRMVNDWMELDVMRDRRRFIEDGLKQHRAGNFRVAIPVLLPHLEGIAVDAFEPRTTKSSPKDAVATAAAVAKISGPAIVEAITILWAFRTFSDVPAGSRQLNRHLVLHGRSTGFGTAENSVKLFFAFDVLAAVIAEAEERSTEP